MTEHRALVRRDDGLSAEERDRVQLFLKIAANSGGYGIWAEYNRHELPAGTTRAVAVHGRHDDPFTDTVTAPEEPGRYCYPPLAAVITAGARLLLGLLERSVTDHGGTWAIADTDSMGIVATQDGGLVPCPGGPHQLHDKPAILALSYAQVEAIRARFAALNPYDPDAIDGSILKSEVDATCYAIAAKRYALYRHDNTGVPRLVPDSEHAACSHGLGHLLNPIDPDEDPEADHWIRQLWQHHLAEAHGAKTVEPVWFDQPALARVNAMSPRLLRAFAKVNASTPYPAQVKPFNFLTFAPGARPPANHEDGRVRLVAPYGTARQRRRAQWVNVHNPDAGSFGLDTDRTRADTATTDSHRSHAARYFAHAEAKSAAPDGAPSTRGTSGLLRRRPVTAELIAHIGKEANQLDQRETGQITTDEALLSYRDQAANTWHLIDLPRLRELAVKDVAAQVRISERRLRDIYGELAIPRSSTRARLLEALPAWGAPVPSDQRRRGSLG